MPASCQVDLQNFDHLLSLTGKDLCNHAPTEERKAFFKNKLKMTLQRLRALSDESVCLNSDSTKHGVDVQQILRRFISGRVLLGKELLIKNQTPFYEMFNMSTAHLRRYQDKLVDAGASSMALRLGDIAKTPTDCDILDSFLLGHRVAPKPLRHVHIKMRRGLSSIDVQPFHFKKVHIRMMKEPVKFEKVYIRMMTAHVSKYCIT